MPVTSRPTISNANSSHRSGIVPSGTKRGDGIQLVYPVGRHAPILAQFLEVRLDGQPRRQPQLRGKVRIHTGDDLIGRRHPIGDARQHLFLAHAAMIGILLVGLLERRNTTIMRMGYDSLAVILLFFCGLGLLATIN